MYRIPELDTPDYICPMHELKQFFTSRHFIETKEPDTYEPMQLGASVRCATSGHFTWEDAEIVIVGCGECRGEKRNAAYSNAPEMIREELYCLYNWHPGIKIADLGDVMQGARPDDTRAALNMVLHELALEGKTVIVLGGSHDLTVQQYEAFRQTGTGINATIADMLIDLNESTGISAGGFLMDMLTAQPNFVRHYSHIGFQSYYIHPRMLETLDKLRFDFFRLGRVREHIEEMEPVLRNTHLFSFDTSVIRYSDAPANRGGSPNGLSGEEACTLMRYAGMSDRLSSLGIYGYDPEKDVHRMTAKQVAQMIWYFIDGYQVRKSEAPVAELEEFMEFHVSFTSNDTTFLKSKRTGRWWMMMPDRNFIPCSYNDYLVACNDEIPERWLREQERLL